MKKAYNRGYTLIELMITVLLIAILAAVTVPKLTEIKRRNRLSDATNLVQRTIADARALAMKSRQAVVVEIRNNAMWVNLLDGADCSDNVRKRCFDLKENDGVDATLEPADPIHSKVYLATDEFVDAGVAMCDVRVALVAGSACVVRQPASGMSIALCYNGTGQLWIRERMVGNTDCTDGTDVDTTAVWERACVGWLGATPSSDKKTWMSGADIRFNRFDSGTAACPAGDGAPTNAVDVTRRVMVPAGGHPYVKLIGAGE
ncbi:MAG: prepilin-type N-terminal cleavage/methylation domain-containing protein [Deltaproteobacteria bacterium]|nr:prepilin-type N-terminal cleavage/methylation domain-containing protein [Deltaproteobacteria bacterium]